MKEPSDPTCRDKHPCKMLVVEREFPFKTLEDKVLYQKDACGKNMTKNLLAFMGIIDLVASSQSSRTLVIRPWWDRGEMEEVCIDSYTLLGQVQ